MAPCLSFTSRGRYERCLTVLIIAYIIASTTLFLMFNRIVSKRIYSETEQSKPSWRSFDGCSKQYLEIMGQQNYVCRWLSDRAQDSTGNYVIYGKEFAILKNVIIDPAQGEGRKHEENFTTVLNQDEKKEYMKLKSSYFRMSCHNFPKSAFNPPFNGQNHLNYWVHSVNCSVDQPKSARSIRELTIAIQRYEYVNLYHTMTDFYNAFLISILFNKSPSDINILFFDSHPTGSLDSTWGRLFRQTYRTDALTTTTEYSKLVWAILGYNSPLNNHDLPFVPYLEQFREFFLVQHGVDVSNTLRCNKLSVLFIWRRDYVAHPRNPSGIITRKIKNEDELYKELTESLHGHDVTAVQLDRLEMVDQLQLISKTDILIGMHGAGLSHVLFLPKHAGLIELYPTYWSQSNRHFRSMAAWRGLHYLTWKNHDISNEFPNKTTYIPPRVVINMLNKIKDEICKV